MTTTRRGYRGFGIKPYGGLVSARRLPDPLLERTRQVLDRAEAAVNAPYVGVTTDGAPLPDLFPVQETGVSTKPVKDAADRLLLALTEAQRTAITFPIDAKEWRTWANPTNVALRHGVCFEALSEFQREAAFGMLRASLSAHGFATVRNAMKLNEYLRQLTGYDQNLGEWLYWLSLFGTPSLEQPWGWQLDGHHVCVNAFFLKDQMVLTPTFIGAEPSMADDGPYAGTRIFAEEERNGLELIRSLSPVQQETAVLYRSLLSRDLPPERNHPTEGRMRTGMLQDNVLMPYEGIRGDELSDGQQRLLVSLLATYVGCLRPGHAQVRLDEVKQRLGDTYFAWIGGTDDVSPFYYKVQSPVICIEFDQHRGVFIDNAEPEKFHSHTVVRTPNGNDYGKDLLRQHLARFHTGRP